MPHFFCPPHNIKDNKFFLTPEESHHIINVLRKKIGDKISIFDGEGNSYQALITAIDNSTVKGIILQDSDNTDVSTKNFSVRLFISIPKKHKLEEIIEKLAQIGVDEIYPVISERTIVRLSEDAIKARVKRWNTISLSASKQSGRCDVLKVHAPVAFKEAVVVAAMSGTSIVAWEAERDNLGDVIKKICCLQPQDALPSDSSKINFNLFIGPEGGYTLSEIELAKKNNFITVGLGKNILKTDTAAIVLSSIIMFELCQR